MKLLILSTLAVFSILQIKSSSSLPPQYRAIPFDDIQVLGYPQTIPDDNTPTYIFHKIPLSHIHHKIVRRAAPKFIEPPRYIDLTKYADATKYSDATRYSDAQSRYIASPKYLQVPKYIQQAPKYIAEPKYQEAEDKSVEDEEIEASDSTRHQRQASDFGGGHGGDYVDYGAYTGGYGAFGWYTDHPVHHGHR